MTHLLRATLSAIAWLLRQIAKLCVAAAVVLLVVYLWRTAHAEHATYYADRFENHRMANGDRFHQAAATCAHPRLPLGTVLHLRNPVTQAEATCLVTDRPARRIRHTDLPRSVFLRLGGELRRGTVPVVEEVAEVPVGRKK